MGRARLIWGEIILTAAVISAGSLLAQGGRDVEVIENGKKPGFVQGMPSNIEFKRLVTIGVSDDPNQAFSQLAGFVVVDDGRVFALDMQDKKVKIYNSEGKFIRAFGREGQGPGELSMPSGISMTPKGELMVEDAMNRRLSYFSLEGEFLRQLSIADKTGLVNLNIGPGGNMLGREIVLEENQMFFDIKMYDQKLKPLFKIDRMLFPNPLQGKINIMEIISLYQFDSRAHVVYGCTDQYEIKFYDREGRHYRTVKKDYDPVKITQTDMDEMVARIPDTAGINLKERLEFPENFPAYSFFSLDEKNYLYIRTYEKGRNENEYALEVFNPDGRFFAKAFTEATPMLWKGRKVYSIEENEEGYQVIRGYEAQWK
jgi:hypothetical protein